MSKPAPVVLFTYNRLQHTRAVVEALLRNKLAADSTLIVYSDGPKNSEDGTKVQQVREYLRSVTGFFDLKIVARDTNAGLSNNIIEGVSQIVQQYGRVIVMEDDLITSPFFLQYMNEALDKYEHIEAVISIHGYCLPIDYPGPLFFLKGADCWGWATWQRGWQLFNADGRAMMQQLKQKKLLYAFDFEGSHDYSGMLQRQIDGQVNSWAIRWYASAFLANKLTLYPGRSLVQNIGADGSGTHPQDAAQNKVALSETAVNMADIPVEETRLARKLYSRHFYQYSGIKGKLRKWLKWGY